MVLLTLPLALILALAMALAVEAIKVVQQEEADQKSTFR